jgi:hypothetical protein
MADQLSGWEVLPPQSAPAPVAFPLSGALEFVSRDMTSNVSRRASGLALMLEKSARNADIPHFPTRLPCRAD